MCTNVECLYIILLRKSTKRFENMFFKSSKPLYTALYTGISKNIKSIRYKSGPIESTIRSKLEAALETTHLDVNDLSQDGTLKENTHLRLVVVTDKFHGLPMYKRYNLVNDILKEELQAGTYTFTIVAKTPIQWHRSLAAQEHSQDGGQLDK